MDHVQCMYRRLNRPEKLTVNATGEVDCKGDHVWALNSCFGLWNILLQKKTMLHAEVSDVSCGVT